MTICGINHLKREEYYKYSDFTILYRTNAQSRVLEEEMLKENLPYRVIGSFYFYSRKEIKDLIKVRKSIFSIIKEKIKEKFYNEIFGN